jgi:DtxR family Mn-dependent transcriptional regulator
MKEVMLRVPASCRPKSGKDHEKSPITESIEEYTEGIFRLQEELAEVGTGDIAKYMCCTSASVTTMLKRLSDLNLVEHTPYQGVRLTEKGEALSVSLLRKHRLVERLLVDFLDLPWDDVHDLACKLEHYISEEVADNIAKAMGYPTTCPHGNPIDATEPNDSVRISEVAVGATFIVTKISDERPEFLTYILDIGLLPKTTVTVKARTPFGDVMTVEVLSKGTQVAIGRDVANSVWVKPAKEVAGDDKI